MRNSILLVLSLSFIFSTNLFSQYDFKEGYYISLKNDTIHGLLYFGSDISNSKVCIFKNDSISETVKFNPKDIIAYRYNNSKYYVSKRININNTKKYVFAEFLVNGIADLYYLKGKTGNAQYFIEKNKGELIELTNEKKTVYINGNEATRRTKKYIGLLNLIFSDCKEIKTQINKTDFTKASLINITKKYHEYKCPDKRCITYEKKMPVTEISYIVFAGMGVSQFSTDSHNNFIADYDESLAPLFGAKVNFSLAKSIRIISLEAGLIYTKHFYHSYSRAISYSLLNNNYNSIFIALDIHYLKIPLSLKLTYPKYKLKPFLDLGFNNIFVLNVVPKETKISTSFSPNTYHLSDDLSKEYSLHQNSFFVGLGLQYTLKKQKSIFIEAKYEHANNLFLGLNLTSSITGGIIF